MRSLSRLFILSTVLTTTLIEAQNTPSAPVITDNTPGQWVMVNPNAWFGDKAFVGQVSAATNPSGGVVMTLNFNGGNPGNISGGPFKYHIHQYAVPSNGSCAAAGVHLDPTNRGETPACDSTQPATCQVGDLSGKHGECATLPGCTKNFTDPYLSLTPGNAAYVGDKSIVIHFANETRLACANFVTQQNFTATASAAGAGGVAPTGTGTGTGTGGQAASTVVISSTTTTSSTTSASTGAAANAIQTVGASALLGMVAVLGLAGL